MENLSIALNLFLAGFIIVFAVLIMLIVIIKLYSTIIQSVTGSARKKAENEKIAEPSRTEVQKITAEEEETVDDGVPPEVIAAIAAAVDTVYGAGSHKKIKSMKRAKSARSAWAAAGVRDNTRPF